MAAERTRIIREGIEEIGDINTDVGIYPTLIRMMNGEERGMDGPLKCNIISIILAIISNLKTHPACHRIWQLKTSTFTQKLLSSLTLPDHFFFIYTNSSLRWGAVTKNRSAAKIGPTGVAGMRVSPYTYP